MIHFEMTEKSLDVYRPWDQIKDDRAGARVIFEGLVRNHNEGLGVSSLEYQAYEEMAILEGQKIVDQALEKFDIYNACCVHRVGHLEIGEYAVVVCTWSAHRNEAFLAAQYIIDVVKRFVPIWKREHYLDKAPTWIACHQCGQSEHHDHA